MKQMLVCENVVFNNFVMIYLLVAFLFVAYCLVLKFNADLF